MKIKCIGSGSKGNCYVINDGHTQLMLECGLSFKEIQRALDFKTSQLHGCLITHIHSDHIKGLKEIARRGLNCYVSQPELNVLQKNDIDYRKNNLRAVEPLKPFEVHSFIVLPFEVEHDTLQPLGYLIQSKVTGEKLLFATDTYFIRYKFKGITHMMLECNHSKKIIEDNVAKGITNKALRERIEKSHFSIENVIIFLKSCDLSQLKEVYLLHLSDTNSDEEMFKKEIQKHTGCIVEVF